MPVVGRRDDHGVDVRARQDLAIVARGDEPVAEDLAGARQAAVVDVGDGHQLDAGDLERGLGVARALAADADRGEADALVGRLRPRAAAYRLLGAEPSRRAAAITAAAVTCLRKSRRERSRAATGYGFQSPRATAGTKRSRPSGFQSRLVSCSALM